MELEKRTDHNDALLSVIVPIYNAERFLRECLQSIMDQTYENLEVILVDDGSTDQSAAICEEFARDSRIGVIHQKNKGVNAARETGLSAAHGKYIAFVDADDVLEKNAYYIAMNALEKMRGDMACFRYSLEFSTKFSNELVHPFKINVEQLLAEECSLYDNIYTNAKLGGMLWNKIWRADCLTGISFRTDIHICEDAVYVWDTLKNVKRAIVIEASLYHYRFSLSNATNNATLEKYATCTKAWDYLLDDARRKNSIAVDAIRLNRVRWILKAAKKMSRVKKGEEGFSKMAAALLADKHVYELIPSSQKMYAYLLKRQNYRLFGLVAAIEETIKRGYVRIREKIEYT